MEVFILLLVVLAVVAFALATFGVGGRFNLIALGLLALAAVQLLTLI